MFDEAPGKDLHEHADAATEMIRSLFSIMGFFVPVQYLRRMPGEDLEPSNMMVKSHNDLWKRMSKDAPPGMMRRYAEAMTEYADSILKSIKTPKSERVLSIEELLAVRRKSSGIAPCFALMEYVSNIRLPTEFFEMPEARKLQEITIDLMLIHHDMLSYLKEEGEGVGWGSVIHTYRGQGLSVREAFDAAEVLLNDRCREMNMAKAGFEATFSSHEVGKYMKAVERLVNANILWR